MRYLLFLTLVASWLYSSEIAVVMIPDSKHVLSKDVMLPVQNALQKELSNFSEDFTAKVISEVDDEFKYKYAAEGFAYLKNFAEENDSKILVILEYKIGAHAILVQAFVADGTNTSKNGSIKYSKGLGVHLPKVISNRVLQLLVETGEINENNRYL